MKTCEKWAEQLWNDLVALQKFQINLIRSEGLAPEDFEDEDEKIWESDEERDEREWQKELKEGYPYK